MSPFSQISWNRNGFSVTFDHNVTEAGTSVLYPDLNVYYNGLLRETNDLAGGFHEEVGCIGQFTIVPYTGVGPVCTLPTTAPSCPTATQQFDMCYLAYGPNNAWAVAISATVTGGPFGLDYGGSGGGYREYTVVSAMTGTRTTYDASLSASPVSINSVMSGGVLYSVSSSYSYLSPGALVNASGLTFGLASAATVVGGTSSSSINLMSPTIGVYQENSGTLPAYSYLRHTFLSSAGSRYCVPSYQPAGCAAPSGSLASGSVSVQLMVTSPSYATISANPTFGYKLMEDIAYTIGTGQLYALPLMSCASATQSGANTTFTILISNAAGNASALAAAIQAQVIVASTTLPWVTRQSGAILSTTLIGTTSLNCPTSSNNNSGSGLSNGAIAGIVIGSVVGALLLLLLLFLLFTGCATRRSPDNKPARMTPSEESQVSRQEAEMTVTQ